MGATTAQPGDLKALALKVLERNRLCNPDATEVKTECNFEPLNAPQKLHTSAAVRSLAGDDWAELETDPAMLAAFASAVQIRRTRELGEIPENYTAMTICAHCGPVPIFPGVDDRVASCPWCFNRIQGLTVPTLSDEGK